jgi:hypothetical protein
VIQLLTFSQFQPMWKAESRLNCTKLHRPLGRVPPTGIAAEYRRWAA